ncbi:MAG: hypothetical protein NTV51_15320 [Verrucomicrobia bacterium]|nr:hypothetical protein [Verrucomicrobiota bacterium]
MKSPLLGILWLVIAVISSAPLGAAEKKAPEPSLGQRIYHFEHRLLPKWTHQSNGAFFADLSSVGAAPLLAPATDIVSKEFAEKLAVRALPERSQVLVTFPKPTEIAHCYFAIIEKTGETFRYITLELTEDLFEDGTKAVVGEWTADGSHKNRGPRKYADAERFLAELAPKPTQAKPQE